MKRLCLLLFLAAGCERELPIDVPQTVGRPVVEANVSLTDGVAEVRLTRSIGLSEVEIPPVAHAAVEAVHVPSGKKYTLLYHEKGWYRSMERVVGAPGDRFAFAASFDGATAHAQCTVPLGVVPIDSMRLARRKPVMGPVSDSAYTAYVSFTDPRGPNYYHLRVWVNSQIKSQITAFSDMLFDGQPYTLPCNLTLYPKDTVRVELQHVAPEVYRYYFELRRAQSAMSDAPANPTSNVAGMEGVLGYFSAYTASSMTSVLEP